MLSLAKCCCSGSDGQDQQTHDSVDYFVVWILLLWIHVPFVIPAKLMCGSGGRTLGLCAFWGEGNLGFTQLTQSIHTNLIVGGVFSKSHNLQDSHKTFIQVTHVTQSPQSNPLLQYQSHKSGIFQIWSRPIIAQRTDGRSKLSRLCGTKSIIATLFLYHKEKQ
jgi:hypothetical protein